jgi:hypothetical protein
MLLRTSVLPVENLTMTTEAPDEHGLPRDPISHRLYITNSGNSVRNLTLFQSGDTEYSSLNKIEVSLDPGKSQEVLFLIIIPNLRAGTILHHQVFGVISGVGSTPAINFTTLIDKTSGQYFTAEMSNGELVVTNRGNVLEDVTITAGSDLCTVDLTPSAFTIDLDDSVTVQLSVTMTDLSIPYGSSIPVFFSIFNGERYFVNSTRLVAVPPVENVSLTVDDPTVKAIPDSFVDIPVIVRNTGNVMTTVFFSAVSSGPEPVIVPSPVTLNRNAFTEVNVRVRLEQNASELREISFTAAAGETLTVLDLVVDPTVNRDFELSELSVRTTDVGTRFTINLYNNGDVTGRFDISSTCGDLDLLIADVEANDYVQFHLIVPSGFECPGEIHLNATASRGDPLTTGITLIPPPFVEITIQSPLPVMTAEPFVISASGGYDTYEWRIDSRTSHGDVLYYNFTNPGLHPITLTVTDDRDIFTSYLIEIDVGNRDPVIVITTVRYENEDDHVEFDARDSFDPDGIITEYTWSVEDQVLRGPVVHHMFLTEGTYTVILQVQDDMGGTNSTTITVNIRDVPEPEVPDEESEEIDMVILGISLLILLCIIGYIVYSVRELDFEEQFMLGKLSDIESDQDGGAGEETGPDPGSGPAPDPGPPTEHQQDGPDGEVKA